MSLPSSVLKPLCPSSATLAQLHVRPPAKLDGELAQLKKKEKISGFNHSNRLMRCVDPQAAVLSQER